ncbi:MAG: SDR family oxidoreductase [Spirochaetales bacterium]|nr:SDR family oxidoreductase [Spirochaetales bacterium]
MGKNCVITGANTGIGKATAAALAGKDFRLLLACRNKEKADAAAGEIIAATGNKNVEPVILDLSSFESIREAAETIRNKFDRLDVLVNNAGIMTKTKKESKDGFELTFAVNHLGHFLLTNLLLDLLVRSAPSRIVNVSSEAHRFARFDLSDPGITRSWSPWRAYANSKLCNIYFTRALAGHLEESGVTVSSLSPGFVDTELGRDYAKKKSLLRTIMTLFAKTPEEGAATSVFLASSPEIEGVTGGYFSNCRQTKSSRISYDRENARLLWEESRKMCGLV